MIVTLQSDGNVKNRLHTTIGSETFGLSLGEGDRFGSGLAFFGRGGATLGEDTNDYINLVVGADGVDDGFPGHSLDGSGAVYILRLIVSKSANTVAVHSYDTLSQGTPAYKDDLNLQADDSFGLNMGFGGDLDGDGKPEILVARYRDATVFSISPKTLCSKGYEDGGYTQEAKMPHGGTWTSCTPCPPDKYKANDTLGPCHACPEGRTTGGLRGQTSCWRQCPQGKYANFSLVSCQPCPKGTYHDNVSFLVSESQCLACPAGKFGNKTGLTDPCTDCSPGYW